MITLTIDPGINVIFPALRVGGFIVEGLDKAAPAVTEPMLEKIWSDAKHGIQTEGLRIDNLSSNPVIQDWRITFTSCGFKPSTYKSSVEALARRVLKDGAVHTPLPIVDLYCSISALKLAPLGGYDLDYLPTTSICVRQGQPETDDFEPLGGRKDDMPITPNVIVYASGGTVLCWLFNHRDSRQTCLRPSTKRAVFFSEAVTARQFDALKASLDRLAEELRAIGAHVGPCSIASRERPRIDLLSW